MLTPIHGTPPTSHSKIHNADWTIELGPDRLLTIHYPDGTIHNTGPPNRRAA
ncbi:MAG: hypothetical protein KDB37_10935 [Ilumatobacter sp.]|nr:hypothetical protein [Ilumatobacter sp.]